MSDHVQWVFMSRYLSFRRIWRQRLAVTCSALVAATLAHSQDRSTDQPAAEKAESKPGPAASGALPWAKLPPRISEPVLRPPTSPREILQRYEIGPSQLEGFFHGQPLEAGEEDVLAKILLRYPRLGLDNIESWRRKDVTWDQLAAGPSDYRAEIFALRGRATRVQERKLLPELAELMEFEKYYQVTLTIDDSPYRALVCTRKIPAAWKIGEDIDEQAAADGLFLKLGIAEESSDPVLIFAAGRIAWQPDRPVPSAHITADQVALAKLGFDVGLFDDVRAGNGRGIGDNDREAFYQLLAALGRAPAGELHRAGAKLDLVALIEKPQEHHGDFLPVQGTARRIMKVPVSDRDVQRRFGIDHYYEIDMSLPLGDKTLRFGKAVKGEQQPVYENSFPATLNVLRLPPGLREGDNLSETIRADAVFFKLWTYRSTYTSQFNRVQPAPLFFAVEPQVVHVQQQANWVGGSLVAAAFVLAAVVIGAVFWWYRTDDQAAQARKRTLVDEEQPAPDFSGLK
jgi:hypothetical protein